VRRLARPFASTSYTIATTSTGEVLVVAVTST
jgi:hypothetical protein